MKNLFIASEVRSGSTFAAELLAYTINNWLGQEFWDLAQEKYSSLDDRSKPEDIQEISNKIWINRIGFRSAKIMCDALSVICREASRDDAIYDSFYGEESYWIIIKRKDTISQAVSLAYARADGVYHSYEGHVEPRAKPVSMGEVDCALKAVLASNTYLDVFRSMPKRSIQWYYEDILDDNLAFVKDVMSFIGIDHGDHLDVAAVKLARTASSEKAITKDEFKRWLLKNFHKT